MVGTVFFLIHMRPDNAIGLEFQSYPTHEYSAPIRDQFGSSWGPGNWVKFQSYFLEVLLTLTNAIVWKKPNTTFFPCF